MGLGAWEPWREREEPWRAGGGGGQRGSERELRCNLDKLCNSDRPLRKVEIDLRSNKQQPFIDHRFEPEVGVSMRGLLSQEKINVCIRTGHLQK